MTFVIVDLTEENIKAAIERASDKNRELLEEYLSYANECTDECLLKDIKEVLKLNFSTYTPRKVFKDIFGTSNRDVIASIFKKILETERYNEYCKCVIGVNAPSYFGWYD